MLKSRFVQAVLYLGVVAVFFGTRAIFATEALAQVAVYIDVPSQSMTVNVDGAHYATWPVSTARRGYHTVRGNFRVQRLARMWYSKKYDNAPMPNSIFFHGGYAIHGSYHISALGRPASHGCVRLAPGNAAQLYRLVETYGAKSTRIAVGGREPWEMGKDVQSAKVLTRKSPRRLANNYSRSRRVPNYVVYDQLGSYYDYRQQYAPVMCNGFLCR